MPLTPQINITGTLDDIFGASDQGYLLFTLCGYGSSIPRISGTALLAKTRPTRVQAAADGTFSATLWGNDVIVPGPNVTYYTVELQDEKGNTIACSAYQFAGAQTVDLSTVAPFIPFLAAAPLNAVLLNPAGVQTITAGLIIQGNVTIQGTLTTTGAIVNAGLLVVAFSATAQFNAALGVDFEMTLTGNVTAPTLINTAGGVLYTFTLIQDATGNRTFAWPANVKNASVINPAANSISVQTFIARANGNLYPVGPMTYN